MHSTPRAVCNPVQIMGSHCKPHMCVDSSIHSESAAAGRQATSRRRTGRTLTRAEGDQEEKPTEARADIWRCMTEPGRVRPSRPSRCLPGSLRPLSASGVEHDNMSSSGSPAASEALRWRRCRTGSTSPITHNTHTNTHPHTCTALLAHTLRFSLLLSQTH